MPRKTTPHVSEAVDSFIRVRSAQLAKTTCANDRSLLNHFAKAVGDPRMHLLAREHVEEYFVGLAEQKPRSWNKVRSRLGTFLDWSIRRGYLDTDLLVDIRPKRVAREQRLQLSVGQLRQLLEVPDPRDRARAIARTVRSEPRELQRRQQRHSRDGRSQCRASPNSPPSRQTFAPPCRRRS